MEGRRRTGTREEILNNCRKQLHCLSKFSATFLSVKKQLSITEIYAGPAVNNFLVIARKKFLCAHL
jgi:hypothetical protein